MPMTLRHLAPAGAPIRARDLAAWCRRWPRLGDSEAELREQIAKTLERRHCWLTSTGRAGLTVLLSALKALAPGDEVVLPSYTCYSLPASVTRAGLRPRIVDIDPASLDFDLERLGNADFRRVLAIVPTSLYGLPSRLDRIAAIGRDNNVFVVDDAAQSLGATLGGRPCGGWGDAALLSFDKGKPVSAIDGGAIVSDDGDIAAEVERVYRRLPRTGTATNLKLGAKLAAYAACLRPALYWVPNSLPGLGLGLTEYRPDFAMLLMSPWMAALAAAMWHRLPAFLAARRRNAAAYTAGMRGMERLAPVLPASESEPAYLRFPVLADNGALRGLLARSLRGAGIGASPSYPGSIADIPELRTVAVGDTAPEAGRAVAERILTLPTHPHVTGRDVERALAVVANCLARRGRPAGV